jgi:hypothetical protein
MKKHLNGFAAVIAVVLLSVSCGPSQRVTSSWKNPSYEQGKRYTKVFIAALTHNQQVRVDLENNMAAAAQARGLSVVKSQDIFPPSFTKDKGPDKDVMLNRVRELGCDLIFTTTLIDRKSEARYVPGTAYPYVPYRMYGMGFRGYYNYWWPFMYDPGYYTTEKTYTMEGNLFDVQSELLIWSVQTESYNPSNIATFSRGLTEVMMERAVRDLQIRQ